jgi:hypothetical protein
MSSSTIECGRHATGPATEREFDCLPGCMEHVRPAPYPEYRPDPTCWTEQPAGWVPTTVKTQPVHLMALGRRDFQTGEQQGEVLMYLGASGDDSDEQPFAEMTSRQARWLADRLREAADRADLLAAGQVDAR